MQGLLGIQCKKHELIHATTLKLSFSVGGTFRAFPPIWVQGKSQQIQLHGAVYGSARVVAMRLFMLRVATDPVIVLLIESFRAVQARDGVNEGVYDGVKPRDDGAVRLRSTS